MFSGVARKGEMLMKEQVTRESSVHGAAWDSLHGGYFSDDIVAAPFIDAVNSVVLELKPDVIMDLGGGTGFLLTQLAAQSDVSSRQLVNIDCSGAQLQESCHPGVSCVCRTIPEFERTDAGSPDRQFLFMMRSVLHYFGENGLLPILGRIRAQAREGEFFAHQTASFRDEKAAACLNSLYRKMRTDKWYPTVDKLCRCMAATGWQLVLVLPAPALPLTSDELGERYGISKTELVRIKDELLHDFGEIKNVFTLTPGGFRADLHYWIYVCSAGLI
jgi:hypothetical protein